MIHINLEQNFFDLIHQLVTRANNSNTDETFLCIVDDSKTIKYWKTRILTYVDDKQLPITITLGANGMIVNDHIRIQFLSASTMDTMGKIRGRRFDQIYVDLHQTHLNRYHDQLKQIAHYITLQHKSTNYGQTNNNTTTEHNSLLRPTQRFWKRRWNPMAFFRRLKIFQKNN